MTETPRAKRFKRPRSLPNPADDPQTGAIWSDMDDQMAVIKYNRAWRTRLGLRGRLPVPGWPRSHPEWSGQ